MSDSVFDRVERRSGDKAALLAFIENKDALLEPLMLNFASLSEEYILTMLAPFWFGHVSGDSELTPFENAKRHYPHGLRVMPMAEVVIDDAIQFCYPEDEPQRALFGVAQNGGLVVLYPADVVWFKEPDGSEHWARMS